MNPRYLTEKKLKKKEPERASERLLGCTPHQDGASRLLAKKQHKERYFVSDRGE